VTPDLFNRTSLNGTAMTDRVVLLHGLWMNRLSMQAMAARLRRAGFDPEIFGYATVAGGPDAAIPRLVRRLSERPCHVLAHSLGGLVTLSALQQHPELPVSRVVCLGSPLCGSAAAGGLAGRIWTAASLGRSADLLRRGCGAWAGPAQVGMIAGRSPYGLGRFVGHIEGDNDGTVSVAETRLPGLADHTVIQASHSGLLFSAQVARLAVAFFRRGRFDAATGHDE
jgi:pimeloyl-ACP methyl ester carboxylesterase